MNASLVDDALLEIFRRLDDADDVMRCRLVCRRWNGILVESLQRVFVSSEHPTYTHVVECYAGRLLECQYTRLVDFPQWRHGPFTEVYSVADGVICYGTAYLGRYRGWTFGIAKVPDTGTFVEVVRSADAHENPFCNCVYNGPRYRLRIGVVSHGASYDTSHGASHGTSYDALRGALRDIVVLEHGQRRGEQWIGEHTRYDSKTRCAVLHTEYDATGRLVSMSTYEKGRLTICTQCDPTLNVTRKHLMEFNTVATYDSKYNHLNYTWHYYDDGTVRKYINRTSGDDGRSFDSDVVDFHFNGTMSRRVWRPASGSHVHFELEFTAEGLLKNRGWYSTLDGRPMPQPFPVLPEIPKAPSLLPPNVALHSADIVDQHGRPRRSPDVTELDGYAEFAPYLQRVIERVLTGGQQTHAMNTE
jgi:hypothetical protein